jgi:hypothetical protein
VNAIDRWLFAPAPAQRLAALRVLVGGYAVVFLLARWPSFWTAAGLPQRQFEPVGPVWWMDAPADPALARAVLVAVVLLGVLFVAGIGWRVVGPLFAIGFFVVAAYRVSWGHVIHSEHLPALHLLVVGFAPAADAWRVEWPARRTRREEPPRPQARYGWPIRLMGIILIVTYLLAGWMKLRNGGWDWVDGRVLRNQIAYDNLRKELLGSPHSPVGGWLVRYDWAFPPMAWATMVIELGAPLALLGRRVRTAWAVGAWGFHVGIVVLMAISFPYQVAGIAYLCLFAPERAVHRATTWWKARGAKEANKSPDRAAAVSRT